MTARDVFQSSPQTAQDSMAPRTTASGICESCVFGNLFSGTPARLQERFKPLAISEEDPGHIFQLKKLLGLLKSGRYAPL